LFTWLFRRFGLMPHGGLALANSAATLIESVVLLALMRRRLNGLEEARLAQALLKAVLAGAGMAVIVWVLLPRLQAFGNLAAVGADAALGVAAYGLLLALLRSEELGRIFGMLRERLARR
jgi:putative peptidoglycan lipid II flippase